MKGRCRQPAGWAGVGGAGPHSKCRSLLDQEHPHPPAPVPGIPPHSRGTLSPSCKFKREPSGDKSTAEDKKKNSKTHFIWQPTLQERHKYWISNFISLQRDTPRKIKTMQDLIIKSQNIPVPIFWPKVFKTNSQRKCIFNDQLPPTRALF